MTNPTCQNCGAHLSHTFADLGRMPVSNFNVKPEHLSEPDTLYPLLVRVCDRCLLVQADSVIDRSEHFSDDYQYFSSISPSWVEHARRYADEVISRFGLNEQSLVIEVASNDGYLLQHFVARGVPVLGIEPTRNTALAAIARGVPTEVCFFGKATAERLKAQGQGANLITSNNVLAHVPDINDFVSGFAELLKPEGVWSCEFPHLLNLIEEGQFDTIYHEHYSYLSLIAVESILARHGLRVFDVQELSTHGGSLRIFTCLANASHVPQPGLAHARDKERAFGLHKLDTYQGFQQRAIDTRLALRQFLEDARDRGKTVAAYGAAAKGNTLLNFCDIGADLVHYVVDRNDQKQGRYLPGSRIPILAPEKIDETRPDYILILPWNLRSEIENQMAHARKWGAKFVVAIPALDVF